MNTIQHRVNVETVREILTRSKGTVLKEFEKICPTDTSFNRTKKDMHDVFDELLKEIEQYIR